MKYDLKTCPFCGGTPYIESDSRGFYKGESTKVAFVRCTNCNMRTERFPVSMGRREVIDLAVKRWNMRFNGVSICTVGDHRD